MLKANELMTDRTITVKPLVRYHNDDNPNDNCKIHNCSKRGTREKLCLACWCVNGKCILQVPYITILRMTILRRVSRAFILSSRVHSEEVCRQYTKLYVWADDDNYRTITANPLVRYSHGKGITAFCIDITF